MTLLVFALVAGAVVGYEVCRVGAVVLLRNVIREYFVPVTGYVEKFVRIDSVGRSKRFDESSAVPTSQFSVRVRYSVDGIQYVTSNVSPWSFISSNDYVKNAHKVLVERFRNSGEVSILYNPESPAVAVVTTEVGYRGLAEVAISLFMASALVPVYFWFKAAGEAVSVGDVGTYMAFGCGLGVAVGVVLFARLVKRLQD